MFLKLTRLKNRRPKLVYIVFGVILVFLIHVWLSRNDRERLRFLDFLSEATLSKGTRLMRNSRVIFAGICRDNEGDIEVVLDYIKHTARLFLDYRIIVFENDSRDQTLPIIKRFQAENNGKLVLISRQFGNARRANIKFMADARNYYINEMAKSKYDSFDYVILVEFDLSYGWDVRSVIEPFSKVNLFFFLFLLNF